MLSFVRCSCPVNIIQNDVRACLLQTSNLMNNETRFDSAHTLLKFGKCAYNFILETHGSFHLNFVLIFVTCSHGFHIVSLACLWNIITNVMI